MNGLDDFNFADYQDWAKTTAIYPDQIKGLYPLLGLVGETGEVVEKILASLHIVADASSVGEVDKEAFDKLNKIMSLLNTVKDAGKELEVLKKDIRKNGLSGINVIMSSNPEVLEDIKKELGDQQWYQAALASDWGLNLQDVAQANHDKLESRKERNVIHGSGDNR